jgi:hypothetical protein
MIQSVLQLFLRYFKTVHPVRMFLHLVWLAGLMIMGSMTYIITFHFQPVMDSWQKSRSINHFKTELHTSIAIDTKVTQELSSLLNETQSDRSYVFRFHNGIPSVAGVPFIFQSNTHEIIRAGVSRVILFSQRIPSSLNSHSNQEFTKRQCVTFTNLDDDLNSINHWYFETRQARSMLRCPIFTRDGDIVGFVGLDWLQVARAESLQDADRKIKSSAATLGKIFDQN